MKKYCLYFQCDYCCYNISSYYIDEETTHTYASIFTYLFIISVNVFSNIVVGRELAAFICNIVEEKKKKKTITHI